MWLVGNVTQSALPGLVSVQFEAVNSFIAFCTSSTFRFLSAATRPNCLQERLVETVDEATPASKCQKKRRATIPAAQNPVGISYACRGRDACVRVLQFASDESDRLKQNVKDRSISETTEARGAICVERRVRTYTTVGRRQKQLYVGSQVAMHRFTSSTLLPWLLRRAYKLNQPWVSV